MVNKYELFAVLCLAALITTSGCSTSRFAKNTSINAYSLVTPPESQLSTNNYLAETPGKSRVRAAHPDAEVPGYSERIFYSSPETPIDDGCGVKDRFDTVGLLAYYSKDRTKRLSFHTGGFNEAVLRYSFKLRNGLDKKDKKKVACLYNSRVQGILGSLYNEMYMREGDNVFDEARKKMELEGLDFWN